MIALHGWLDNAASFDPLAPKLSDARVMAVDLAGHGLSDHRPAGAAYHLLDYVRDVIAIADALQWERFVLMGHSLGAAIASLVAGVIPKRVSRLALIEGLGPLTAAPEALPVQLAASVQDQMLAAQKARPVYANREALVTARRRAGDLSSASARILIQRGTQSYRGGWTWRSDARLRCRSPRLSEDQVEAFLRRIAAPTLLIFGENGLETQYAEMSRRSDWLSDVSVVRLPGGHHLHMQPTPALTDAINAFLAPALSR